MKKEIKELIEEEKFDTEDNDWEKSNNRAVERIINIIKSNPLTPYIKYEERTSNEILLTFIDDYYKNTVAIKYCRGRD